MKNHPKKERMVSMINIIKQEITIDKFLKQRLEFICEFTGTTPTFINGSIRKIDKTNLSYVESHKIIIKDKIFSKKDTREKYINFSRDLILMVLLMIKKCLVSKMITTTLKITIKT